MHIYASHLHLTGEFPFMRTLRNSRNKLYYRRLVFRAWRNLSRCPVATIVIWRHIPILRNYTQAIPSDKARPDISRFFLFLLSSPTRVVFFEHFLASLIKLYPFRTVSWNKFHLKSQIYFTIELLKTVRAKCSKNPTPMPWIPVAKVPTPR